MARSERCDEGLLRWCAVSDKGLVRTQNQDAVLAALPIFAIADGMGGQAAGEVASRLALEPLEELVGRTDLSVQDLVGAVRRANSHIVRESMRSPARTGMGTTLTGFALLGHEVRRQAVVFNVGDSRTYRWRSGTFAQLTVDHSVAQELVREEALSAAEAAEHPSRHVLTRALGLGTPLAVDTRVITLRPADRLLLCSDGLTDAVSSAALREAVRRSTTAQEAAQQLVQLALRAGAPDNVSVTVVDVASGGSDVTPGRADADGDLDVDDTAPR